MQFVDDNLAGTETTGSENSAPAGFIDIHCHCLPGVDDGPGTITEALELCTALVDDGMSVVIATPHQLGRFGKFNKAPHIRQAVFELNEELKNSSIQLTVVPGADIRVDERICQLLKTDEILTLADGGKYVLLELPSEVFIDIEPMLIELAGMGIVAVISHPERHFVLAKHPNVLLKWRRHSAHLQLTAGSLLGEFGMLAQAAAWRFLNLGLASLIATDAHNQNIRRPRMKAAFERIACKLGKDIARLVCIENPRNILEGRDLRNVSHYTGQEPSYVELPNRL